MTDKIAIIGFGNIAKAIITPLLDKNLIQPENVYCVVNSEESLENLKKIINIILMPTNQVLKIQK